MSRSGVKLIAIGFNMQGNGLTRVMHSILPRLADRHEIHYLGIGYSGETIRDRGLTIHPTNLKGGDVFAAFQAKKLIEEINPALVFILQDIWCFGHYLRILAPYRDRLKIVCCIPMDGKIARDEDAASLEHADRIVVYTEFARKEVEGAFDRLREKRGGGEFPAVDVIPHGIDRNRFDREVGPERLFDEVPAIEQCKSLVAARNATNRFHERMLPARNGRHGSGMVHFDV